MAIGAVVAWGIHLFQNYRKIQHDITVKATLAVAPFVDGESIAEIGYIYAERRETSMLRGDWNLVWFIKVPSTNASYSASYQSGYSGFKVGDSLKLIHRRNGDTTGDYSGFVVGLHGDQRYHAASVWAIDLVELYSVVD